MLLSSQVDLYFSDDYISDDCITVAAERPAVSVMTISVMTRPGFHQGLKLVLLFRKFYRHLYLIYPSFISH